MIDDGELLRRYAEEHSETAFTELVQRHYTLVHSTALRRAGGNGHRANDITQGVFTDLARKAASLSRRPVLSGWLYLATRRAAAAMARAEQRRAARERKAQAMEEILGQEPAADWYRLRPVLDDAMGQLSDRDREVVLLRFFEGHGLREIGSKLRLSEDAARMRVDRAVERLRGHLSQRGISSSGAALAVALAGQPLFAAPAELTFSIANAAMIGAAGPAGGAGLLRAFFVMNKITAGVAGAVLLVGVGTTLFELQVHRRLSAELNALQEESRELSQWQVERQPPASAKTGKSQSGEIDDLLKIRREIDRLKARPAGVLDAAMKTRSTWHDAGHATLDDAMESLMSALATNDYDSFSNLYFFRGSTKEKADELFASLSPEIQAKYKTPEALLAPLFLQALKDSECGATQAPQAYQVYAQVDHGPDTIIASTWETLSSGAEQGVSNPPFEFHLESDGWRLGPITISDGEFENKVVPLIDPATGSARLGNRIIAK